MTRASTLLLLLAALDGTRGGEVYIEPAYTAAIGDYACVRLDSAADALYTMDEDIYIDADKRDLNEACLRLGNSTATEMALARAFACWPGAIVSPNHNSCVTLKSPHRMTSSFVRSYP